jgi:hypothetical protein
VLVAEAHLGDGQFLLEGENLNRAKFLKYLTSPTKTKTTTIITTTTKI